MNQRTVEGELQYECRHCNQWKSLENYYHYSKSKCKSCWKAYRQKWEKANPDKMREKQRRRCLRNPALVTLRNRMRYLTGKKKRYQASLTATGRWARANRVQKNVHQMVYLAVKSGRMIRPEACSECGFTGRITAHHHDYSKPYDVEWLCVSCHKLLHNRSRAVSYNEVDGQDFLPKKTIATS